MLKNLLYVFLWLIPFLAIGMEEGWKPVEGTDLFRSIRLVNEKENFITSEELDTKLKEIEDEFFQNHKEIIGTYKHYSGLEKALAELSNATNYKMAITTAVAQYYWNKHGDKLAQEGFKAVKNIINKENVMLIIDKSQTAIDWLMKAGIVVGTAAQKAIMSQLPEQKKEDLTASSFTPIENTAFIPSINTLSMNNVPGSAYQCIATKEQSSFKSLGSEGFVPNILYISNPKFRGHVKAEKVYFIQSDTQKNDGINDIDTLKNLKILDQKINEGNFIDGSGLRSPITASIVFFLMNNLDKSKVDVKNIFNPFPKSSNPLSTIEVMADEIVINDKLAQKMVSAKLSIENILNTRASSTGTSQQYATIKTLTYLPIVDEGWVEMTPEIAAKQEGFVELTKSSVEQFNEEITMEREGWEKAKPRSKSVKQKQQNIEVEVPHEIVMSSSQHEIVMSSSQNEEVGYIKTMINKISSSLYDEKTQKFVTENCQFLMQKSEKINEIADIKVANQTFMTPQPREYFIFEDMNFGSFMQSYRGLSMVRFTHVKTSHDKAKDFFLIAPKQIIKYFDPKTVTQSKLNYTYTTISEPYEISELKQRLNDIFENKISLPIFEPLFEVKKEKSKIKMLTVDEINEWINRSRDLQGTFLHSSDKTAAQLLTNQVIVQFLSEIQEPIKNTLSVIGQSKIFSKLHGEILIKLSELIMVHKSYTTNVVNAEDAIRIFINEIAPTRGYDYQGKFGLITTRDYFYFLVPIALIRSLKELVVNNIDFEWIGLYQVDVNVEILKSALNKCYATNSTDLRSAINREVINSQKRWYKPWTWNWGGYYFKKESYKRDYPEKAKAYAAAQKELLAEE